MIEGNAAQFEDQQTILPYLLPAEKLVWSGRPPTGLLFRKTDVFLIPFSLLWLGFACFWEFTAYSSGAPVFFLIFGGAFVTIGLFITLGRFVYDMLLRGNTIYALTNERVLILAGLFNRSLRSLSLKNLPQAALDLTNDGRGTITFGVPGTFGYPMNTPGWPGIGRMGIPMFERIENANEVYKMIQTALNQ